MREGGLLGGFRDVSKTGIAHLRFHQESVPASFFSIQYLLLLHTRALFI
jgi:hypothetical protein